MIHYAKLANSKRLQKTLAYLRSDGGWHSTRDIVHGVDVCAVNSIAAELRCNGIIVERRQVSQDVHEYRVVPGVAMTEQRPEPVLAAPVPSPQGELFAAAPVARVRFDGKWRQ